MAAPCSLLPSFKHWLAGTLFCLCLLTVGCSSKGTVTGRVTYQGKSLSEGSVIFTPEKGGGGVVAAIREDGSYSAFNVPAGLAKISVLVVQRDPPPPKILSQLKPPKGQDLPEGVDPNEMLVAKGVLPRTSGDSVKIPKHYGNPDKSGLTYEVKSGPQEFNIDLK